MPLKFAHSTETALDLLDLTAPQIRCSASIFGMTTLKSERIFVGTFLTCTIARDLEIKRNWALGESPRRPSSLGER